MRLITRSDFDGIVCAALLREVGIVEEVVFAHPKDVQDGLIDIKHSDCLANMPYDERCGLWFDNRVSEQYRYAYKSGFKGVFCPSPSVSRIIYNFFGGYQRFTRFEELVSVVDRFCTGNLTIDEVLSPKGWIMIGFILDPRSGFGRHHNFMISNYKLMEYSIEWIRRLQPEQILNLQDVIERTLIYKEHSKQFVNMLLTNSYTEKNVVITDLRKAEEIFIGNRFIIHTLFPKQNTFLWITKGKCGIGCSCSIAKSIINKTSTVSMGTIAYKYKGGGNEQMAGCQFNENESEIMITKLTDDLTGNTPIEILPETEKKKKKFFFQKKSV